MATKVKGQRLDTGAAVENLGFNPDKRPLTGEGAPIDTPEYVGQQYVDTTTNRIYFAIATTGDNLRQEVGEGSFDPNGYYPSLHAGISDNIYTTDNIIDVDVWNFRTTAGSQSVPSSGTASLNYIRGKSERTTARTECIININTSDGIYITNIDKYAVLNATNNTTGTTTFTLTSGTWDTDPSTYGITVSLQLAELDITGSTFSDGTGDIFKTYVGVNRGDFEMNFDSEENVWRLINVESSSIRESGDTTTFGITTPGSTDDIVYISYEDACTDGTLELIFTAESRGVITNSEPRTLLATGVNQFDGNTILSNVEIDNGEIVSGSNYIVRVPAYGGVVNGYMGYCPDGYIVNCGRVDDLSTTLQVGTAVDTDGAVVTSTSCYMPNEETGYFLVEVSQNVDDTELSVHPKRSGQQDTNTDAYSTSAVTLPTADTNSTALPTASYGMPSLGGVYDELSGQTQTYIKRIEVLAFSYSDLVTVAAMGVEFDYDTDYIYYVLGNPITYTVSFDNTYIANDYGTELILDSNNDINAVATENSTSYGSNLVDKLRTGVVTKEEYPQVIDQDTYDDLPATKNTDGIIRFIFTEEA